MNCGIALPLMRFQCSLHLRIHGQLFVAVCAFRYLPPSRRQPGDSNATYGNTSRNSRRSGSTPSTRATVSQPRSLWRLLNTLLQPPHLQITAEKLPADWLPVRWRVLFKPTSSLRSASSTSTELLSAAVVHQV